MNNKEQKLLKSFQDGKIEFSKLPESLRDNVDVVRMAVEKYGYREFEHASFRIRNEASIILSFVGKEPRILRYVIEPVRQNYLATLDGKIIGNKEVSNTTKTYEVSAKVNLFGSLCISENPASIRYMPQAMLQNYLEFLYSDCDAWIEFYGARIKYSSNQVSPEKRDRLIELNPEICRSMIEKGYVFPLAVSTPKYRDSKTYVEKSVEKYFARLGLENFEHASDRLKSDVEFANKIKSKYAQFAEEEIEQE